MNLTKRVTSNVDLSYFQRSSAYRLILTYIEKFCVRIKGRLSLGGEEESGSSGDQIVLLLSLLGRIEHEISRIDPIEQPMRFGNRAFRQFHTWLEENIESLLGCFEPSNIEELKPYILDAFGNPIRIDYGTGHEAAFLMFLIVLIERNELDICAAGILVVFRKYIDIVRILTTKYSMEPAGSHGVWGLDDFHHLPFLFGAAQLIGHENIVKPSTMLDLCEEHVVKESLYADMIRHIKRTKCKFARLHEVSPLLYDFTRLESWSQVCMGLMGMYKSDVLGKRPIVQHFFFGNVLKWEEANS
jgi:serine/threonine-protein phosphatase 2A activator